MYLISPEKTQYKANLHAHSTVSDGRLTPEQVKDAYKSHGYQILCITDHEVPRQHQELSDPDFLMLTGYECYIRPDPSGRMNPFAPEVHLNLFARDPYNEKMINFTTNYCNYLTPEQHEKLHRVGSERPREYTPAYINEYIATAKREGYIVAYNHFGWSLEREEDVLAYEGCFSMEIFNYSSFRTNQFDYNANLYDKMLRNGQRIACHAADDNHDVWPIGHPANDSFGGFAMILPEEFTYDSVIDAMEKGEMYASRGPLFEEISMEGNKIYIRCSPVKHIHVLNGGKQPKYLFAEEGKWLTEAEFEINPRALFVRTTIVDEKGRTADTRGYFRDELPF